VVEIVHDRTAGDFIRTRVQSPHVLMVGAAKSAP
jgi:hypothetical protein